MLTPDRSCFRNKALRQIKCDDSNIQPLKVSSLADNSLNNTNLAMKINYDGFIYKDHVTFNQYTMESLKKSNLNHREIGNISLGKSIIQKKEIRGSVRAFNNIRKIRNNLLSNSIHNSNHKSRQSFSQEQSLDQTYTQHYKAIQNCKYKQFSSHQERYHKEIYKLNKEIFRKYLSNQRKYDKSFDRVYKFTNVPKSSFNSPDKCKQVGKLLRKCRANHQQQNSQLIKLRPSEKDKINKQYDEKFGIVWNNLSKQIGMKVKSQAQFKWQFKRRVL